MKNYLEMAGSVLARRDKYILERRRKRKKAFSVLSCLCLAALLGVGVWRTGAISTYPPSDVGIGKAQPDGGPSGYPTQEGGTDKREDRKEPMTEDSGGDGESESSDIIPPGPYTDAPAPEEPGSTGALTRYEAVWGGSYMDQDGRWVVWLTENTPENQEQVLMMNPGLTEGGTVFQTADYSLAYLTELMAKISGEMGTGKSLDFVSTAALREERNRVEVTLATEDAESVSKVLAFDTIGGAIEIRYGSEYVTEESIQKPPLNKAE